MSIYMGYGYGMPKVVKGLIIANAVVFVLTMFIPRYILDVNALFGLVPYLINHKYMVWQFFTYMFLHGNIWHIFFNMLILWMFGAELEYNWGSRDFFLFYIICGIGGGLLVWLTAFTSLSSSLSPTIGASGAIFGLLVAFGLMWPDRLIFIWGIIPMKALHMVLLFGALDLFSGLTRSGGNIAVFAHVGGGLTGYLYLKFGWRMAVHLEGFSNRWKRRRFTVMDGGASRGFGHDSETTRKHEDDDAGTHPDFSEEVDRILDKIARDGIDSLSDREKKILERASNRRKR